MIIDVSPAVPSVPSVPGRPQPSPAVPSRPQPSPAVPSRPQRRCGQRSSAVLVILCSNMYEKPTLPVMNRPPYSTDVTHKKIAPLNESHVLFTLTRSALYYCTGWVY